MHAGLQMLEPLAFRQLSALGTLLLLCYSALAILTPLDSYYIAQSGGMDMIGTLDRPSGLVLGPSTSVLEPVPDPFADVPADTDHAFAFYNFYLGGLGDSLEIAKEQMDALPGSGALNRLERVFYLTIGGSSGNITKAGSLIPKGRSLGDLETGSELATLSQLWNFCRARPAAKVLYFHPKGAYHPSKPNIRFRKNLNCYVLNPACLDSLDSYDDVCGMRASPFPHLHLPGNMWWARCSHIARLVDPFTLDKNGTVRGLLFQARRKLALARKCGPAQLGIGRFFAESWVGTAPDQFRVADCLRDEPYVNGYVRLPEPSGECPKLECGNATMLVQPKMFYNAVRADRMRSTKCPEEQWIAAKSEVMYGEPAELVLRWRSLWRGVG